MAIGTETGGTPASNATVKSGLPASPLVAAAITAYLVVASIILIVALFQVWPPPGGSEGPGATPAGPAASPAGPAASPAGPAASPAGPATPPTGPGAMPTRFLVWSVKLSAEVRLMLVVALAGALGGMVHALRSLYWYIGNRNLKLSWLAMYILLPFVGATMGLVFYFLIRGGFFSPEANAQETNEFGFAALGGLVGLFSEQAAIRLQLVAETIFAKPAEGANPTPQEVKPKPPGGETPGAPK